MISNNLIYFIASLSKLIYKISSIEEVYINITFNLTLQHYISVQTSTYLAPSRIYETVKEGCFAEYSSFVSACFYMLPF